MDKPIIAIDFSGALLKNEPFDNAHKDWFVLMAHLLNDQSLVNYAGKPNYFEAVDDIMSRYLGEGVEKKVRTAFARELFSMVTIAKVTRDDLKEDFATYLSSLKVKYNLVVITSTPDSSVMPILEKVGCGSLFDLIYSSPSKKRPNKAGLFEEFMEQFDKPVYYVGADDKDREAIETLGITTLIVDWFTKSKTEEQAYSTVEELKKVIPL